MREGLNWGVFYKGKLRALFVTRWRAESFIETLHNKDEWSIKYVPDASHRNIERGCMNGKTQSVFIPL